MCQHIDKCVSSITEYITMIEHGLHYPLYPDLLRQLQNMYDELGWFGARPHQPWLQRPAHAWGTEVSGGREAGE